MTIDGDHIEFIFVVGQRFRHGNRPVRIDGKGHIRRSNFVAAHAMVSVAAIVIGSFHLEEKNMLFSPCLTRRRRDMFLQHHAAPNGTC